MVSWKSNSFELSSNRLIVTLFIFVFVLTKIQRAASTEKPQFLNTSGLTPIPKANSVSASCTPPENSNLGQSTSCSGYTTFPTVNVHNELQITDLIMDNGNNLGSLKSGQLERANLSSLLLLNLRNCQITQIERGTFRGGNGLQKLYLDYNQIEVLDPQVFNELVNLNTLNLGNNPIKSFKVGSVFPPLMSLLILDINSCQLSVIPENTFGKLRKLKRLRLDINKLSTLSWKMFTKLGALEYVKLGHNSWHCDCHVKFLRNFLSELGIEIDGRFECHPDQAICPPEIEALGFISKPNQQTQLIGDITFECTYSGHPPPNVTWFKDGNPIRLGTDSSSNKTSQNMTQELVRRFNQDELARNIWFKQVLILGNVTANESGNYSCLIQNEAGKIEKAVLFKFNESPVCDKNEAGQTGNPLLCKSNESNGCECDKPSSSQSTQPPESSQLNHSGMNSWVWILITIFGVLLLLLLTIIAILARKVWSNRKQEVVIDFEELNYIQEPTSQQQEPSGANPVNIPLL